MVPKSREKNPYKTQKRRHRHRGGGHVKMEAEMGVMQDEPWNTWNHESFLEEARKDSLLEPLEKCSTADTLIFLFLAF